MTTVTTPIDLKTKSAPRGVFDRGLVFVNAILSEQGGGHEGASVAADAANLIDGIERVDTPDLQADVVDLFAVRDGIKALSDRVDEACRAYGDELYRRWAETGVSQVKLGEATVHVQRAFKPTAAQGKDALVAALESSPETADLVRRDYNYQSLRAWVASLPKDDNGEPVLPDHIQGKLATIKESTIRVRRS